MLYKLFIPNPSMVIEAIAVPYIMASLKSSIVGSLIFEIYPKKPPANESPAPVGSINLSIL